MPGARYTNLRDVRQCKRVGFIDIEWKSYCFKRHLEAVKANQPLVTVARDIEKASELEEVLAETCYFCSAPAVFSFNIAICRGA